MAKPFARCLLPVALLLVAGCSGTSSSRDASRQADDDDNIKAPSERLVRDLLQAHFDANPVCTPFFAMPRDVSVDAEFELQRMQAFADAGLVRRDGELTLADPLRGSGQRKVIRYMLTPEGEKAIHPGSGAMASYKSVICYGRRAIGKVEIGDVTQATQSVEIRYRYTMKDQPAWVSAPAIRAFYPGFEKWLADRVAEGDSETLGFKDGEWSFDRTPAPAMFDIQQLGH